MKAFLFAFVVFALCCFALAKTDLRDVFKHKDLNHREASKLQKRSNWDDEYKYFYSYDLPCEYTVDFIKKGYFDYDATNGTISFAGDYAAGKMSFGYDTNYTYVFRPDILDPDDYYYVAQVTLNNDMQCSVEYVPRYNSFAYDVLDHIYGMFTYKTLERNQEWNGIRCNLYTYSEDSRFCVDADKRIVGVENYRYNYTFYYRMEVNEDDFIVPANYVGCNEEQPEVYEAPSPFPDCNDDSSDSSDSSSLDSSSLDSSSYNTEYFTPELPCSFTVDFTIFERSYDENPYDVYSGTASFAGLHQAMRITEEGEEPSSEYVIVRSDIEGGRRAYDLAMARIDLDDEDCEADFEPFWDSQAYYLLSLLNETLPYHTMVANESWNGVDCDMYYQDWASFCVDADKHVIGIEYPGYMNYTLTYRMEVNISDFILSSNYSNCSDNQQFFSEPKPFPDCREIEWDSSSSFDDFEPADLPCAYTVDFKIRTNVSVIEGTYSVLGKYKALKYLDEETTYIERRDVNDTYLIARVMLNLTDNSCYADFVDPDDHLVPPYEDFVRHMYFDMYDDVVKDQEWDGIKCDMYYYDDGYSVYSFCADSNDVIVGVDLTQRWGVTYDINFTFHYIGTPTLDDFAVPSNYAGCSSYAELYNAAKPDPKCELNPSDPSGSNSGSDSNSRTSKASPDSASTVKAIATVVLAMVLGTLITLF